MINIALISGLTFGVIAGITPGPTLMLLISQTIRFGRKEGMKVAFAPLVTDAPIVFGSIALISIFTKIDAALGVIALLGAAFIGYLAYELLTTKAFKVKISDEQPRSLMKGIVMNLLNPHPYVFWLTVGAPLIVSLVSHQIFSGILFLVTFYACFVGSKLVMAVAISRSTTLFLRSSAYVILMRLLGLILIAFVILFLKDGLHYLHLI